jgi:hypothetical protein
MSTLAIGGKIASKTPLALDDLKSGRANPIDGEEALRRLSEKSERRRSGG